LFGEIEKSITGDTIRGTPRPGGGKAPVTLLNIEQSAELIYYYKQATAKILNK